MDRQVQASSPHPTDPFLLMDLGSYTPYRPMTEFSLAALWNLPAYINHLLSLTPYLEHRLANWNTPTDWQSKFFQVLQADTQDYMPTLFCEAVWSEGKSPND